MNTRVQDAISERQILDFLKEVDTYFPVHLSDRTNLKEYARKLYENSSIYYIKKKGKIIALLSGYTNNTEDSMGFISILAVLEEYRGKGIAHKLINSFIDECKQLGHESVHLYTSKRNHTAIQLYENMGFEHSGLICEEHKDDIHFVLDI